MVEEMREYLEGQEKRLTILQEKLKRLTILQEKLQYFFSGAPLSPEEEGEIIWTIGIELEISLEKTKRLREAIEAPINDQGEE